MDQWFYKYSDLDVLMKLVMLSCSVRGGCCKDNLVANLDLLATAKGRDRSKHGKIDR